MFPALQVLAHLAPRAVSVPVGGHIGLKGRKALTFGRDSRLDVPVSSTATAELHCAVEHRGNQWMVRDVAGVWGTYVNGQRLLATQLLRHGDVIELKGAVALRFLERPFNELRLAALEAPLLADPADETAWGVYSDWLTENGSAFAEQVNAEPTPEAQARWAGPLARLLAEGELEVEWHHGHAVRAVLRRLQDHLVPRPEVIVELLLEAPSFHFLQALEVDFSADLERMSEHAGPSREKFALALARAVARSPGALGLKSFTIGPVTRWKPSGKVTAALVELAKKRPLLVGGATGVVRKVQGASLEVVKESREVKIRAEGMTRFALAIEGSSYVAPRNNALIKLVPAKKTLDFNEAFVVWHVNDVWNVTPPAPQTFLVCSTLKVNGRERRAQCLREGDVIELLPGLEFRFVNESG